LRRLDNFIVIGNRLPFAGAVFGTAKRGSSDAAFAEHRANLLRLKRPVLLSVNPKKEFHKRDDRHHLTAEIEDTPEPQCQP
jgi:hypothetical protein